MKIKVALLNTPWARKRLENIAPWWGLPFEFSPVVEDSGKISYQPFSDGLAVLDDRLVAKFNDLGKDATLAIMPYKLPPIVDFNNFTLFFRASVMGLYIPNKKFLEVFANETDHMYYTPQGNLGGRSVTCSRGGGSMQLMSTSKWQDKFGGVTRDMGDSCTVMINHELSHKFCIDLNIEDKTHDFFYSGNPEGAREYILKNMPKPAPVPAKKMLDKLCLAMQVFEDYVPPGGKYRNGKVALSGSLSWRNNNPGNCKFSSAGYRPIYGNVRKDPSGFAIFPSYELGFLYMKNLITQKIQANPTWTIYDMIAKWYAPSTDNNNPTIYASFIAERLGVGMRYEMIKIINA